MKLQLLRETLLKPLQMVIGVVERKQTLPILANVLVSAKDNKISITGTDLEVELIGQADFEHGPNESHQVTVPGRKLMDICKALPENAAIELYREKEKIVLRSGRSRFTLSTLPAEDFPNTELHETTVSFSLSQSDLYRLLHRTHFAMAQQDVRYYLNGLFLEIKNDRLRAVATDGHRLSTSAINVNLQRAGNLQIIIPRKGVLELLRLLVDADEPATITISSHHFSVSTQEFTFTSKLIDGRFPDYEKVIPKGGDKIITIARDVLKQSLSRAAILCNEKFKGIRFELRNGLLRISASNPEQEAAEEEINIDYSQEELDIAFNAAYLLDILNIVGPEIQLVFSDANSSVLIKETEDSAEGSVFVVMPMRL